MFDEDDPLEDAIIPAPSVPRVPANARELDNLAHEYVPDVDLAAKRASGELAKLKARVIVEDKALPAMYKAFDDGECSYKDMVEMTRTLMELGDMKPKQQQVQAGPGFSVNINIPALPAMMSAQKETTADVVTFTGMTIDLPSDDFSGGLDD
jgi:hypothetical protein